jgi:ppGpp synthetase/RelA/SpoT-type nucleotidyltranferase
MQKNNNSLLNINRHNLVQWMVKYDKPEVEKLLKILLLSSEVQIRTLIQHFEQFR